MAAAGALIISDGCVAGLLACASVAERRGGPVWVWTPSKLGERRAAAARAAELYGQKVLELADVELESGPAALAMMLLRAAGEAERLGLEDVLWPVVAPEGAEPLGGIAANVERALLVGRLMMLGERGEQAGIRVQTPYADIGGAELADLVLDMDLPIWTCWWFDPEALAGEAAGRARAERERWTALLHGAGWRGPLPNPVRAAKLVRSV